MSMAQLYRAQPARPLRPESVVIPGPVGPLEAIVEDPGVEDPRGEPVAFAVVCHPHPLYQGTMRNKVVHTIARAAIRLGAPAVRFNFRGVGASGGTWDEGAGETADALAVIEWARRRWPARPLWLAGFSFGAFVALEAAGEAAPAALVTVAPPVHRFRPAHSRMPAGRWLLVQGEDDELVDSRAVIAWAKTCPVAPRLALLPQTSHFFHGRLGELRAVVQDFLDQATKQGSE
jgi:uncharacterized protein